MTEKKSLNILEQYLRQPKKQPECKIMNPMSDFFVGKNGEKLSEYQARLIRICVFLNDVNKEKAYTVNGRRITLGKNGADIIEKVDRINGKWYVQNKFHHKIVKICGKNMVLLDEITAGSDKKCKFYTAKLVKYNEYGKYISDDKKCDCYVAMYKTRKENFYGYGETLCAARESLLKTLYGEFKDVINVIENNKIKTK